MITVVIPFFQRRPGVLAKALASIAGQQNCPMPIHVVVVDDASPVPASADVDGMPNMPWPVQVITQANGGPGAARNTGIANAPDATRYIAFLDSDDEWTPDHLARAVSALQAGHGCYFADHYQLGQTTSAFVRAKRIQPETHPHIAGTAPGLHAYQGNMLDQIIFGNVIGTSTVVYDAVAYRQQRFRVEFTNAGEDYLFWMELAQSGAKFAFSNQPEATYGRGVNVYSGAGWGSEEHLLRIHNEMKYRKTTLALFDLSAAQTAHVEKSIEALRGAFARDLLHRLAHRKKTSLDLLRKHAAMDTKGVLMFPATCLKVALGKA
jgi:succinoglycan biosynthesis protein ExoW